MTFDFTVPITWADIINVISTLMAFAAVVVAIVANYKSSQSLKYSLKMQEQSKNIDLFEKRIALINDIRERNSTDATALTILFDQAIVNAYNELQQKILIKSNIEHDLSIYEHVCLVPDGEGGYISPIDEIKRFEAQLEEYGYPEDRVKEFQALCLKHQISHSETSNPQDTKIYNYSDLVNNLGHSNMEIKSLANQLLNSMQEYVQQSIASIK